ncbi:MAG: hypothetical protein ACRDO7_12020, partial [Nocardioidaceae bacterium]
MRTRSEHTNRRWAGRATRRWVSVIAAAGLMSIGGVVATTTTAPAAQDWAPRGSATITPGVQ